MQISNNKILITGGASGIGLGLTERFVKENNTVIICGRRQEALDEVTKKFPNVITRSCNLEIEEERIALFEWVSEKHPDINVLVNNAGIQNWMKITENNFFERAKQEININVLAPLHLTSLFIQLTSLTTIINVTSGLAFVPLTKVPVYSATKAFFRSFTLSVRQQLQNTDIEIIEIIPPKLNTDLGGKGLHDDAPPVSEFLDSIFEQLKDGNIELGYMLSAQQLNLNTIFIKDYFKNLNEN
ncbi:SDR family oxidoreductase [Flavobacterium sp. J27]|uniref:SDR family oxidoreductase n=1 Tax=Flavobacterium sp. J27 TaxID=2060419 RepID=UPI00102F637D|nr:SDR family NAD(P)-dependent oxidoreductase [Flavobacterium sp. J27]